MADNQDFSQEDVLRPSDGKLLAELEKLSVQYTNTQTGRPLFDGLREMGSVSVKEVLFQVLETGPVFDAVNERFGAKTDVLQRIREAADEKFGIDGRARFDDIMREVLLATTNENPDILKSFFPKEEDLGPEERARLQGLSEQDEDLSAPGGNYDEDVPENTPPQQGPMDAVADPADAQQRPQEVKIDQSTAGALINTVGSGLMTAGKGLGIGTAMGIRGLQRFVSSKGANSLATKLDKASMSIDNLVREAEDSGGRLPQEAFENLSNTMSNLKSDMRSGTERLARASRLAEQGKSSGMSQGSQNNLRSKMETVAEYMNEVRDRLQRVDKKMDPDAPEKENMEKVAEQAAQVAESMKRMVESIENFFRKLVGMDPKQRPTPTANGPSSP